MQLRVTFPSRGGSEAEGGGSWGVSDGFADVGWDFARGATRGVAGVAGVAGAAGKGGGGTVIFGFGVDKGTIGCGGTATGAAGVDGGAERGEGIWDVFGGARMLDFVLGLGNPSTGGATPAGGARTGATSTPEFVGLMSGGGGIGGGAIGIGAGAGAGVVVGSPCETGAIGGSEGGGGPFGGGGALEVSDLTAGASPTAFASG